MERHMKFFLVIVASTILGTWFATDVAKQPVNEEIVNESYVRSVYQDKFGDLVTFLATLGYVHQALDGGQADDRMDLLVRLHLAKVGMLFGAPHVAAFARVKFNEAVLEFMRVYGTGLYDYVRDDSNIVVELMERHMKFFLVIVASTILGTWFATDVAKQPVNEEIVNESYVRSVYQDKFGDLVTFLATLGYVHQALDGGQADDRMDLLVRLHLAKVGMLFGAPHVAAFARVKFNEAVLEFMRVYGTGLYDYVRDDSNIVVEFVAAVADRISAFI